MTLRERTFCCSASEAVIARASSEANGSSSESLPSLSSRAHGFVVNSLMHARLAVFIKPPTLACKEATVWRVSVQTSESFPNFVMRVYARNHVMKWLLHRYIPKRGMRRCAGPPLRSKLV